jgi:hypothetical protein
VQMGQLTQHLAILSVQALDKHRVIKLGLAVRLAQIAKGMQPLQDSLAPWLRQFLPAGKEGLLDVPSLLRRHLFPHALPVAQSLLLLGREPVPRFQTLANLRLLVRRQVLEPLVVLHEPFLLARSHILQPLDRLWGQLVRVWRRRESVRQFRTPWRPLLRPFRCALMRRSLGLTVRNAAEQADPKTRGQYRPELESQPHYLDSLVTSSDETFAEFESSLSTSNFDTTS